MKKTQFLITIESDEKITREQLEELLTHVPGNVIIDDVDENADNY